MNIFRDNFENEIGLRLLAKEKTILLTIFENSLGKYKFLFVPLIYSFEDKNTAELARFIHQI